MLVAQASLLLINDVQFVLQLLRLHRETFEENVCKRQRRKVKSPHESSARDSHSLDRTLKPAQKLSADKGSFYLITVPQMPGGKTQICIPSSGEWRGFFFRPPLLLVSQKIALRSLGRSFITLQNWWSILRGRGEMFERVTRSRVVFKGPTLFYRVARRDALPEVENS